MKDIDLINRLSDIAVQLSNEQDVDKLLQIILESCIEITNSDAGSIYTVEDNNLHFKYTMNNSVAFPSNEFVMPINDRSISGNCAINKTTYNIKSMSEVKTLFNIEHNESFDRSINYKTINMLVVPLKNYYGDIIGVMQLINKKEEGSKIVISSDTDDLLPTYTKLDEQVTSSLASQAAILIARTRLYIDLSNLTDSMISTLSATLELRDPVTAGHSRKVADYSIELAKAVNDDAGTFKNICFSENQLKELEIAALLHDIGKIGISESILQKENRLSDAKTSEIEARLYLLGEIIKNGEYNKFKTDFVDNIEEYISQIKEISESNFLDDENLEFLTRLKNEKPVDFNGRKIFFLTDEEFTSLNVTTGNLTSEERELINMHAKYTKDILEKISWGKSFMDVPEIAARHHERLSGRGYPYGLKMAQLSIRDRILAITDVFDALTAVIRPYKPAVSTEEAYQILDLEVKNGELDEDLVCLFKKINL